MNKALKIRINTFFILLSICLLIVNKTFKFEEQEHLLLWILIFGFAGFFKAFEGISKTIESKNLNVELLMIIAALSTLFLEQFSEGVVLILIFAVSGLLEDMINYKSEKSLSNLFDIAPQRAVKVMNGEYLEVDVKTLKIGDIVVVYPGQLIPADGVVLEGSSEVDESKITGESIYQKKLSSSFVYSGTINLDSVLKVKVEVDPKESTIQKIVDYVNDARSAKTKKENTIEKIEKYYVYIVLLLALFMIIITPILGWYSKEESFYKGVTVLIVGSPCALVASVSPAVLSMLVFSSRQKILVKDGSVFEKMSQINQIVFDKTGTLTYGYLDVIEIVYLKENIEEIQMLIYNMEINSSHPLAKAISRYLKGTRRQKLDTLEVAGFGIKCHYEGNRYTLSRADLKHLPKQKVLFESTIVALRKEEEMLAYIVFNDQVKVNTKAAIERLKYNDIEITLLSGDQENAVSAIANMLEIKSYKSECLPQEKADIIRKLNESGQKVMMVGDGMNDAPALSYAYLGASMKAGSDLALESSDVILIDNDLLNLTHLIEQSKWFRSIVLFNMLFSIIVIFTLMITNLFVHIKLPYAVMMHEGSTILVILNSLRLLKRKMR